MRTSPFLDSDRLKMALRAGKVSGAFEKHYTTVLFVIRLLRPYLIFPFTVPFLLPFEIRFKENFK